jgi:hypothetical protein
LLFVVRTIRSTHTVRTSQETHYENFNVKASGLYSNHCFVKVSSEIESTRNANQAALFSDNTVLLYFTGALFESRDWKPVILIMFTVFPSHFRHISVLVPRLATHDRFVRKPIQPIRNAAVDNMYCSSDVSVDLTVPIFRVED